MARPIALTDPAAREPDVVGYKAALLAEAGAIGLPTLPGDALPLEASAPAIAAGHAAFARSGPSAAYLAASAIEPEPAWIEVMGGVASSTVVRSTTALDADGRWSGAFASYLDVGASDLATAVKGCWASAFSRDALERYEASGVDAADVRIGVLVQPWIAFDLGGTARTLPDGRVTMTFAPGGPRDVVTGRAPDATTVVVEDEAAATSSVDDPIAGIASEVAAVARAAEDATGIGLIEWGVLEGAVTLLQIGPAPAGDETQMAPAPRRSAPVPAEVVRIAAILPWYPGALGAELVVTWALGLREPLWPNAADVADPGAALDVVRDLAARLTEQVWGPASSDHTGGATATMRLLREGSYGDAAEALRSVHPPAEDESTRVIALIRGLGLALVSRGVLPAPDLVWHLTPAELADALGGHPPVLRRGADRWEPLVADVALSRGAVVRGTAAADGTGAGRLHRVDRLRSIGRPGPRAVLLAPLPLPQLAPLLWHAAGLVTSGGSEGAHLLEVARSLGVPTVIKVGDASFGPDGTVVAVDGTTGEVATLGADGTG